ncbi:NUMOD4 domain-containing protein [Capnocytophaga canis]|uniref:NUMOD4 domain-containing protein n=1 Tax=Capnocytophaga canis TaxID=1848903 RepID=UPI00370D112F
MEIWKEIEGFEELYLVSNKGRVKSLGNGKSTNSNNRKERILKQQIKGNGYLQVKLSKEGKYYYKIVHRLVAVEKILKVFQFFKKT